MIAVFFQSAELIEQVKGVFRFQKVLMGMLAGNTDHMRGQKGQRLKRGLGIIQEYLVSSFTENDSFDVQLTVESNFQFMQQLP